MKLFENKPRFKIGEIVLTEIYNKETGHTDKMIQAVIKGAYLPFDRIWQYDLGKHGEKNEWCLMKYEDEKPGMILDWIKMLLHSIIIGIIIVFLITYV